MFLLRYLVLKLFDERLSHHPLQQLTLDTSDNPAMRCIFGSLFTSSLHLPTPTNASQSITAIRALGGSLPFYFVPLVLGSCPNLRTLDIAVDISDHLFIGRRKKRNQRGRQPFVSGVNENKIGPSKSSRDNRTCCTRMPTIRRTGLNHRCGEATTTSSPLHPTLSYSYRFTFAYRTRTVDSPRRAPSAYGRQLWRSFLCSNPSTGMWSDGS